MWINENNIMSYAALNRESAKIYKENRTNMEKY